MKQIKYIFLIIGMSVFFSACEDYLDKSPDLGLTEEDVFNNFFTVRGYLDKCYDCIVDYSYWRSQDGERAHVGQMSDEGANSYGFTTMANQFNKGNWMSNKNTLEVGWGEAYLGTNRGLAIPNAFYALRIANKVVNKAPLMQNLTPNQRDQLLGQAHFFRAWFYFEIIRRLGGMQIMDKAYAADDDLDEERLTYQQSTDWIIDELNLAISLLPDEWPSQEVGRPNKVSAYALKSMAELYAASPLMKNPIGVIENNGYDIERVKTAATYAKECLEYIENVVPKHKMMPQAQYKNIFYHFPNFVSDESLWYINSTGLNRNSGGREDLPVYWQNVAFGKRPGNYGHAQVSISQNIINKFETVNGYKAELTSNGWESNDPAFDPAFPYNNRDPRFDTFVIYPGEPFGTFSNGNQNYLCTWEGGRDLGATPQEVVRTRYLVKKWQWPESVKLDRSDNNGYSLNYYNCIIIRTTQVWLDYAEAMNEAYGPNTIPAGFTYSAVDAINKIRNRVGMPNVRAEFTSDATKFREFIRDERAVELLLENNRWWDLRRWMIAEEVLNIPNPIKGVKVTASNATSIQPNPGNVFTYELMDVTEEIRVFEKKHYWYPIAQDEANRLTKFKQNPGW
ncbi:MAG: RagB/SusD family nutrient uptake outer membrane protein [Pigmentiphaga sp.]|nr:RagB/SusD family nutrient uptake outer membrane protein [Pigmentiphaga sp.]